MSEDVGMFFTQNCICKKPPKVPHEAKLIIAVFESGLFENDGYSDNPGILQRAIIDSQESGSI